MKYLFIIAMALLSCTQQIEKPSVNAEDYYAPVNIVNPVLNGPIKLWATWYNMPSFKSNKNGTAVRDMNGNSLGVRLSRHDWCDLAMEGTGFIDGKTYNYAGTTRKHKVWCKHAPSGYAKFHVTKYKYGTGNKNNPLRPFVSVACDQKKFKYGHRFYIPSAKGVELPNGKLHSGYFVCEDVGGLIKGNHIDVFIGASTVNPFAFIKSSESKTFDAYTVGE